MHEHEPDDGGRLRARSPTGPIIVLLIVIVALWFIVPRLLHFRPPELASATLTGGRWIGPNSRADLSYALRQRFPIQSDVGVLRWTLWWQGFTVEAGTSPYVYRASYGWSDNGCGVTMTVTWSVDENDRIASLDADASRGVCS